MALFKVYYATEENKREYHAETYARVEASNRIEALRKVFDAFELLDDVVKFGMVVEVDISQFVQIEPKPTPDTTPASVQVQWWRDGARDGLFSQQVYDVIDADDNWTTIRLMGNPHKVATSRTRPAIKKTTKAQVAA